MKTLRRMISSVSTSSKKEALAKRLHDIEMEALVRASYDPWADFDDLVPELERLRDEIRAAA